MKPIRQNGTTSGAAEELAHRFSASTAVTCNIDLAPAASTVGGCCHSKSSTSCTPGKAHSVKSASWEVVVPSDSASQLTQATGISVRRGNRKWTPRRSLRSAERRLASVVATGKVAAQQSTLPNISVMFPLRKRSLGMVNQHDASEGHSTSEHKECHSKGPRINPMQLTVEQMQEPAPRKPMLHFFRGALLEDAWRRSRITAIEQADKARVPKSDVPARLHMMSASALADTRYQSAATAGHRKADQRQVDASLSPPSEATQSSCADVAVTPHAGGNASKRVVPVSSATCLAAGSPPRNKRAATARKPIATQHHDVPKAAVTRSSSPPTQPVISPRQLYNTTSDLYEEKDLSCHPPEPLRPSVNQNFSSLQSSTLLDSPQPDLRQNQRHSRADTDRNQRRRGLSRPPRPRVDRDASPARVSRRKRVKMFRPSE